MAAPERPDKNRPPARPSKDPKAKALPKRRVEEEDEDDEDEDDEDDEPQPKAKAKRPAPAKPLKKKKPNDDEDEDEEDEEEEAPAEINWTAKKLQLNKVQMGLMAFNIAQGFQCAGFVGIGLFGCGMSFTSSKEGQSPDIYAVIAGFMILGALGMFVIGMLAQLVGAAMNLFVPGKAEARGMIIGSIGLVILPIVLLIVGSISAGSLDTNRSGYLMNLLGGVAFVSYIVSLGCVMTYLKCLSVYLKDVATGNDAGMYAGLFVLFFLLIAVIFGIYGGLAWAGGMIPGLSMAVPFIGVVLWIAWAGGAIRFELKVIQTIQVIRKNIHTYIVEA